jgi:hypothetical protein
MSVVSKQARIKWQIDELRDKFFPVAQDVLVYYFISGFSIQFSVIKVQI